MNEIVQQTYAIYNQTVLVEFSEIDKTLSKVGKKIKKWRCPNETMRYTKKFGFQRHISAF